VFNVPLDITQGHSLPQSLMYV